MKKHLLILFVISLILFIWKIGSIPILDGDTGAAAKIAKNIIETNNWITLKPLETGQIVSKPPMFFWMIALGFKLFGINEFGLSIVHSIVAIMTVLLTYLIAKELFSRKTAFLSGLILITSIQFFYQARSPLYDIPLTFFVAASLYAFILFEKTKNNIFYFLVPIFAGCAMMIKGPVGVVLPFLAIFIYLIWTKRIRAYLNFKLILAILLLLCVIAPWHIAEYKTLGKPFLQIFIQSNFGRFFTPVDSIGNNPDANTASPQYDFYSYFIQLLLLFIPWSGFLYPAIIANIKNKESRIILSWIAAVLLFFSCSLNYKISRYILPVFPALAIITAKFLTDAEESLTSNDRLFKISKWITAFLIVPLLLILVIALIIVFPKQQEAYRGIVFPLLSILIFGMLFSSIYLIKNKLKEFRISLLVFTTISYLAAIFCLDLFFANANPIKEFCTKINSMVKNGDQIVLYRPVTSSHFAGFYLSKTFIEVKNQEGLMEALKDKHRVFVISDDSEILNILPKSIIVLSNKSNFSLFLNRP